ncbi:MAG: S-methyl-5-thioribose-1-phosphate isomerase, partial [Anaerovorax sp.]|nr:S-methyl-5-thioribose-1-phosphate isomerase [Anaerovorax sp.]
MKGQEFSPIKFQDGVLLILDQTKLPTTTEYLEMHTKEDVWHAIHKLRVRGAPAIGIAAAYGIYISIKDSAEMDFEGFYAEFCLVK